MLVSALTAPIYARSLIKVLLRRKLTFNVTAKGSGGEPGPAVDLPLLADVGHRAARHPAAGGRCATGPSHDDRLDRRHPGGLPGPDRDLADRLRPGALRRRPGRESAGRIPGSTGRLHPRIRNFLLKNGARRAMSNASMLAPESDAGASPGAGPGLGTASGAGCWASRLRCWRLAGVIAVNVPTVGAAVASWYHQYQITRPAYEAKYGLWDKLNIPAKFRVNGIHSTLLYNGDVLIMAGSGNNQAFFNAGTFKTLLLNPVTMQERLIHTPWDLFCAGHIELPDGNILIAGGTARYENLTPTHAAGSMTVDQQRHRPGLDPAQGHDLHRPGRRAVRVGLCHDDPARDQTSRADGGPADRGRRPAERLGGRGRGRARAR